MIDALIQKGNLDTDTHKKRYETEGRDWGDAPTRRRTPTIVSRHQKLRKRHEIDSHRIRRN